MTSSVKSVTHPDDIVFADYQVFYAAHQLNIKTYYSFYLRAMTNEQRKSIDCLIIYQFSTTETERIMKTLGGTWQTTGVTYLNLDQFKSATLKRFFPGYFHQNTTRKYKLVVYRWNLNS